MLYVLSIKHRSALCWFWFLQWANVLFEITWMPSTLLPNIGGHTWSCQVPHPQIWRQQVCHALTTCSKLSLHTRCCRRANPKWYSTSLRRIASTPSRDKVGCFKSHFLFLWQEDLDCFILSCYYGNLEVVSELAVRQKVDLHTVKEVCIMAHVQSWIVIGYNYIVVRMSGTVYYKSSSNLQNGKRIFF